MKLIKEAFNGKETVVVKGRKFIINPLTEQIPFTSSELLNEACLEIAKKINKDTTKLLTEEDKGAILLAGVSLITKLPFGMARWYPNGLASQIKEKFCMEYTSGNLYINGIQENDRVTLIDDMISTGGTMISLIRAVEKIGAQISKIICIAEKVDYGGVQRVKNETGYEIETLLRVKVSGRLSEVLD